MTLVLLVLNVGYTPLFALHDLDFNLFKLSKSLDRLLEPLVVLLLVVLAHLLFPGKVDLVHSFLQLLNFFISLASVGVFFLDQCVASLIFCFVVGAIVDPFYFTDTFMFFKEFLKVFFDLFDVVPDEAFCFLESLLVLAEFSHDLVLVDLHILFLSL